MMTANPRLSCASFKDNRQYMFVAGNRMIYIRVTQDLQMDIQCTLNREAGELSKEWLDEATHDIAGYCGVEPAVVREMVEAAIRYNEED